MAENIFSKSILEGLTQLVSKCKKRKADIQLGLPMNISIDLMMFLPLETPCKLLVKCHEDGVVLEMEPNDVLGLEGAIAFVHEQLKENLEGGEIGGVLEAIEKYFLDKQIAIPVPADEVDYSSSNSSTLYPIPGDASSGPTSHYESVFEDEIELGSGEYGSVYKCLHKLDENYYAIKKISYYPTEYAQTIREVKMMARVKSPYIVQYYQSWIEDGAQVSVAKEGLNSPSPGAKTLYIAMENCNGTLEEKMNSGLDPSDILRYFSQMLQGLNAIHKERIIHRDLSKNNVLIDFEGKIKISDFGSAIPSDANGVATAEASNEICNEYYRAPEMGEELPISQKADIFSLGLILLEMLHQMKTDKEREDIFNELRSPEKEFDWGSVNLGGHFYLPKLVMVDPLSRPSTDRILEFLQK